MFQRQITPKGHDEVLTPLCSSCAARLCSSGLHIDSSQLTDIIRSTFPRTAHHIRCLALT